MGMVFCRACGKEIHETAAACPSCGAVQQTISGNTTPAAYASYSQVPWFRKNWFILLGALVFAPVTLYSLFSGDIYYEKKGQLQTYSKTTKIVTIVICGALTIRFIGVLLDLK